MDTSFQRTSGTDEWYSPLPLVECLGHFDLDPASPEEPLWRTADRMVDKKENGLKVEWGGARVWLNPPYSQPLMEQFCEKMMEHGNGIVLTFARTGNKVFQKMVGKADGVFFFRHRIKFYKPDGTTAGSPGCDSCLFAFGEDNVEAIRNSGLEGVLIRLKLTNIIG